MRALPWSPAHPAVLSMCGAASHRSDLVIAGRTLARWTIPPGSPVALVTIGPEDGWPHFKMQTKAEQPSNRIPLLVAA